MPETGVLTPEQEVFLQALRWQESGNCPAQRVPDGDGGRAIGPYQIHRAYWQDACRQNPQLARGTYADCRDETYARAVVVAYFQRYCREAWEKHDFVTVARCHNGGPAGPRKPTTRIYGERVYLRWQELTVKTPVPRMQITVHHPSHETAK